MSAIAHRLLEVPAGRIHVVEQGAGPLVLLVHGFPESLVLLAPPAAGARRGRLPGGRDRRPRLRALVGAPRVDAYRMLDHVADNVALVTRPRRGARRRRRPRLGLADRRQLALLRPDVFRAVALSVPYAPRGGTRPTDVFARMGGDGGVLRQLLPAARPGRGRDRAGRPRLARGLLLHALGRRHPPPAAAPVLRPARREAAGPLRLPAPMPAWLTDDDLDVYAGEFERTGFTGGLNRYRNVDRDWEDLAAWTARRSRSRRCSSGASAIRRWGWARDRGFPQTLPSHAGPSSWPARSLDPAGASRRGQPPARRLAADRREEGCRFPAPPVRLMATIPTRRTPMKYMLLIHQGTTPTPATPDVGRAVRGGAAGRLRRLPGDQPDAGRDAGPGARSARDRDDRPGRRTAGR